MSRLDSLLFAQNIGDCPDSAATAEDAPNNPVISAIISGCFRFIIATRLSDGVVMVL
ncbi:MAG: hypothetical protein ABJM39_05660 [Porticoccus sp.]|uniref:hypothetical protein n=1 Tax=Porticoccus sp. TaxID=2024853 RepID=UPI00329A72A4